MKIARLSEGFASATGWPTETWVIRQNDGTPVDQVRLYRYRGIWYASTEHKISRQHKRRALALARIRNTSPTHTAAIEG